MAPRRCAGFTYLGLVVFITIVGMVGALTLKADALLRRAAAEEELLAIGADFADALKSYAAVTPRGQPAQPKKLEDLLRDPRFPGTRRHLRKIFVDPITGKAEWGLLMQGAQGGIVAVHSLSRSRPLKIGNFDARFSGFDNREHIADWKFAAAGTAVVSVPARPPEATPPPAEGQPAPMPPFPSRGNVPGRPAGKPPQPEEGAPEPPAREDASVPREEPSRPSDGAPPQDGTER